MKQIIRTAFALTLLGTASLGQDAMPRGTISYFTGDCPTGWTNSQLPAAALGRSLIATPTGGQPLQGVGDALDGQDDLTHQHTIEIDVGDEDVGLLHSCCNENLGEGGDQEVQIAMPTGDSSGLPFLFLSVCVKVANPDPGPVPSGLMAFQPAACPNGTSA